MRKQLQPLWTMGGLGCVELLRRTARSSWDDDVFGQGGRMAFYQFLALFPSLMVFLAFTATVPHFDQQMRTALRDLSGAVLPNEVAGVFQQMLGELHGRRFWGLVTVFSAAVWAAHNSTWAMIYGLNKAYEVHEDRSWWKLTIVIVGLTTALAITASAAILLIFGSAYLEAHLHQRNWVLRGVQWIVLAGTLLFAFAILYRYAPNLEEHDWWGSLPGAGFAVVLWIASISVVRVYFNHTTGYARSYGHLSGVAMLLFWLYVTNGAILMGGEMNSQIEKAVGTRGARQKKRAAR
jgi:membrane protein